MRCGWLTLNGGDLHTFAVGLCSSWGLFSIKVTKHSLNIALQSTDIIEHEMTGSNLRSGYKRPRPPPSADFNTHAFTSTLASVECVRRRVLHVIVGEMEWKNRSGIWGSSCGFQSDKIQKPTVLVCTPCASCPAASVQGSELSEVVVGGVKSW